MGLTEDDTILHPAIDDDVNFYICNLDEGPFAYTRFFDALLIKRGLHRSFFRDLKAFREQPQVIALLGKAGEDRKLFREATTLYLDSRYAHPWCRETPLKKGYWRAEWGKIQGKQRDAEAAREEQRLHTLLVPIWMTMRSRMFPGEGVIKRWCDEERERRSTIREYRLTAAALQQHDTHMGSSTSPMENGELKVGSDSGMDEADKRAAAHAATSILRLAAAGMIISHTPKRKLRWLAKKAA